MSVWSRLTSWTRNNAQRSASESEMDNELRFHFDLYAGVAYSIVSGGLAIAIPHGPGVPYEHNNNVAPVIGARFAF